LLEQVVEAQENPIQARAQVARWMVSRVDAHEAAEFAAELAERPEAEALFNDLDDTEATSIRQYAWRLALTATVESGDAPRVLRAAFAWADEQGSTDPDTWRYLWTLRTVWEVLEPEQRIEFAQRSNANGYCPPEMREAWGFALAEQNNTSGAIEVLLPMLHEPQERLDAFIERLVNEWERDAQQRFAAAWRTREGETAQWNRARIIALARQLGSSSVVVNGDQEERIYLVAEFRSAVRAAIETPELLPSADQLGVALAIVRDLYPSSATEHRPFVELSERIAGNENWESLEHDLLDYLQAADRNNSLVLLEGLSAAAYGAAALPAVRAVLYRFRDEDGGSAILRESERLLTLTRQTAAVESFVEQEVLAPAALLQQGVREFGPGWAWQGDTQTGAREFLTLAMDYAYHLGHWTLALQCLDRLTEFPAARNQSMLELAFRMQALHRGGLLTADDATYWIAKWGGDEEVWTMAVRILFRLRLNQVAAHVFSLAPERVRLEPSLMALQMLLPEELQTGNPIEHYAQYLEENPDLSAMEIAGYLQNIWRELQFSQYVDRMQLLLDISRSRAGATREFMESEARLWVASGETTQASQLFLPRGSTTVSGPLSVLMELGLPTLAMRALDEQAGQLPWMEYLEGAWNLQLAGWRVRHTGKGRRPRRRTAARALPQAAGRWRPAPARLLQGAARAVACAVTGAARRRSACPTISTARPTTRAVSSAWTPLHRSPSSLAATTSPARGARKRSSSCDGRARSARSRSRAPTSTTCLKHGSATASATKYECQPIRDRSRRTDGEPLLTAAIVGFHLSTRKEIGESYPIAMRAQGLATLGARCSCHRTTGE
jgi:hypothetical protein